MAASNINRVVFTGNLTRDPELRNTPSGTPVCKLRVASNARRKIEGEWVDKPNYFNATVWGTNGENCATYLSKGSPVAVDGRLDWREWEDQDGNRREAVEVIANSVQFLAAGSRRDENGSGSKSGSNDGDIQVPAGDVGAVPEDFDRVHTAQGSDDIPF